MADQALGGALIRANPDMYERIDLLVRRVIGEIEGELEDGGVCDIIADAHPEGVWLRPGVGGYFDWQYAESIVRRVVDTLELPGEHNGSCVLLGGRREPEAYNCIMFSVRRGYDTVIVDASGAMNMEKFRRFSVPPRREEAAHG